MSKPSKPPSIWRFVTDFVALVFLFHFVAAILLSAYMSAFASSQLGKLSVLEVNLAMLLVSLPVATVMGVYQAKSAKNVSLIFAKWMFRAGLALVGTLMLAKLSR